MNRGDIWIIDLGGRIGKRAVVILTRQNVLAYLNKVTIAEITTKGKGYPTEVFIGQKGNLTKPSFVQTDNIHTIPKNKFERFLAALDPDTMLSVSNKVLLALELENL